MATYALDIENPRVQFALNELGISEDELLNRSLEDFASPKILPEIQSLRYQYYLNQLKSTVTEVRTFLKQCNKGRRTGVSASPKETLLTSSKFSETNELNLKQKNFLITAVSPEMLSPRVESLKVPKSEPRFSTKSLEEKPMSRFKEFEEKQREKIKEIRKKQFELQKTYSEKLAESIKKHEKRGKLLELERLKEKQEKDFIVKYRHELVQSKIAQDDRDYDIYIQEKLNQLDKRLQRSAEIHQEYLNKKIKSAQKFRNFESLAENLKKINQKNEVEQVNKFHEKLVLAYQNRLKIEEMAKEEIMTKREFYEKHREQANEKIKKSEEELFKKTARIETKIFESEKLVKKRKEEMMKELIIKQELHRLKVKEKELILARARKRMDNKTNKTLEKLILNDEKIEELKLSREREVEKNREQAIRMMIQKEKIRDEIFMVSKSPKGRLAQEKLIKWNIIARPKTPEEING